MPNTNVEDEELREKIAHIIESAARNAQSLGSSPETLGDLLATDVMSLIAARERKARIDERAMQNSEMESYRSKPLGTDDVYRRNKQQMNEAINIFRQSNNRRIAELTSTKDKS